jgi:hypothetical protein
LVPAAAAAVDVVVDAAGGSAPFASFADAAEASSPLDAVAPSLDI